MFVKDIRRQLEKLLARRILVLDGSWGVLIHRRAYSAKTTFSACSIASSRDGGLSIISAI